MKLSSTTRSSLLGGAMAIFAGCAHAVPSELTNARAAYQRTAEGPASRLVPAELHKAQEALARADKSFNNGEDAFVTRDLSYVAQRKSEMVAALASIAEHQGTTAQAKDAFSERQTEIVKETKEDLSQTRSALMAALAKLAAVKEEDRGLVITLSGSVLFRSGEAVLLPEAQTRLDQVAKALLTNRERTLVVEGHTDAQGSDGDNLQLSQRRADAVRTYLVSRGYDAGKITALGIGEGRPVADNGDAEGRSNNRRVEIIIQSEQSARGSAK